MRWGPNELSFANADAWKDVYDRRKDGKVLVKDPAFYRTDDTVRAKHIVNTHEPEKHAQLRKMMVMLFNTCNATSPLIILTVSPVSRILSKGLA